MDLLEDCVYQSISQLIDGPDAPFFGECHTFVNVRGVGLLPSLGALLLFTRRGSGGLLAGFLLLGGRLASSRGLAPGAGLLLGGFGRHRDQRECEICLLFKIKKLEQEQWMSLMDRRGTDDDARDVWQMEWEGKETRAR